MTAEQRQKYREAARAAQSAVACGRVVGVGPKSMERTEEDIDLVGAQPRVVLELLDYIDEIESKAGDVIKNQRAEIERMRPAHEIGEMIKVQKTLDTIIESMKRGLR